MIKLDALPAHSLIGLHV